MTDGLVYIHQPRDRLLRMQQGKVLQQLVNHSAYLFTPFYPAPGSDDIVHRIGMSRLTRHQGEIFHRLTTGRRQRRTLAFMIGAAFCCYFSVTLAKNGIVDTHVYLQLVFTGRIETAKVERIPMYPPGLPGFYPIVELLRRTVRVCSRGISFVRQHRRSRVMTMPGPAVLRESRDDNVRLEVPDYRNYSA